MDPNTGAKMNVNEIVQSVLDSLANNKVRLSEVDIEKICLGIPVENSVHPVIAEEIRIQNTRKTC